MYQAKENRYESMKYFRCGKSGLKLPAVSLGLWHNFGSKDNFDNMKELIFTAFDNGITHFDLANNYGPVYGSAEDNFGRIMDSDMRPYRNQMVISTKAGYDMWPGPYGDGGSRKYLISSLDESLQRMKLDYVDIFYHHRPDAQTPVEETMDALAGIVRQGKALYIGLSNYNAKQLKEASDCLNAMGIHCLIHQHNYSMLNQKSRELLPVLEEEGIGAIAYCPLAQGLLTDKYLQGIPADSRAAGHSAFLGRDAITPELEEKVAKLNGIAENRGQKLSQMALVWALQTGRLTSVILGASRASQITDNVAALQNKTLSEEELKEIENILEA